MIRVNLEILNSIIGTTNETEKKYREALEKFEDKKRIAETRHNLGILFTKLGDYKSALGQFNISIKVSLKNKNLLTLVISYFGNACIYAEMNELDLATDFIEKGVEHSFHLNDRLTIADVLQS